MCNYWGWGLHELDGRGFSGNSLNFFLGQKPLIIWATPTFPVSFPIKSFCFMPCETVWNQTCHVVSYLCALNQCYVAVWNVIFYVPYLLQNVSIILPHLFNVSFKPQNTGQSSWLKNSFNSPIASCTISAGSPAHYTFWCNFLNHHIVRAMFYAYLHMLQQVTMLGEE